MKKPSFKRVGFGIGSIVILALIARFTVAVPYYQEGNSMADTIGDGELVLVNRLDRSIERGDIVVFAMPAPKRGNVLKRVIGLPGDAVVIRDGEVYVGPSEDDVTLLDEPYLDDRNGGATYGDGANTGNTSEVRILPGEAYFVLGDNRRASFDSRDWGDGGVPRGVYPEDIVGTVWWY